MSVIQMKTNTDAEMSVYVAWKGVSARLRLAIFFFLIYWRTILLASTSDGNSILCVLWNSFFKEVVLWGDLASHHSVTCSMFVFTWAIALSGKWDWISRVEWEHLACAGASGNVAGDSWGGALLLGREKTSHRGAERDSLEKGMVP